MAKSTNWRAMQFSGSKAMKSKSAALPGPGEILPRYMTAGSRRADLSLDGEHRKKK